MKKQFALLAVMMLLAPGHGWAGHSEGGGGGVYVTADGLIHFTDGFDSLVPAERTNHRVRHLPDPIREVVNRMSAKAQTLGDEETLNFIRSLSEKRLYVVPYRLESPPSDLAAAKLLAEMQLKGQLMPRVLVVQSDSMFFQQEIMNQASSAQIEFELLQSAKPSLSFEELIQLQRRYQSQGK